jgi:hypothetical protein
MKANAYNSASGFDELGGILNGGGTMNDETVEQADEEALLSYEASDEALEAAAGNEALPTATFICSGFCCQS